MCEGVQFKTGLRAVWHMTAFAVLCAENKARWQHRQTSAVHRESLVASGIMHPHSTHLMERNGFFFSVLCPVDECAPNSFTDVLVSGECH